MSQRPSLLEWGRSILWLGCIAFGGGLGAHFFHLMVEKKRWLTSEQYLEDMTLAQLLPGPNMVIFPSIVGTRLIGPMGSAVGVVAILLPGSLFLIGFASALSLLQQNEQFRLLLVALSAGAVGLLSYNVVRLLPGTKGVRFRYFTAASLFLMLFILKVPLFIGVLIVAPISIWLNRPGTR